MNTIMAAIANSVLEKVPNEMLDNLAANIVSGLRERGYSDLSIKNVLLTTLAELGCVVTIHEPEE